MTDLHYTDPRLARLYDQDGGDRVDLAFYLSLAGTPPHCILDLGCGTGTLSLAFADRGHHVTGVDPAAAMLAVAAAKQDAGRVRWVQGDAQSFRSADRFDLIVMTGHAFQVLIDDASITAALAVMQDHLAPGGTVAFETRNPRRDWATRWHGQDEKHHLDGAPVHQSRIVLGTSADHVTFATRYAFPDVTVTSISHLRFLSHGDVAARLDAAGLRVLSLFGDWTRAPFDPLTSDEMIFLAISKEARPHDPHRTV
jgi:SAM-dependent methyltransferase